MPRNFIMDARSFTYGGQNPREDFAAVTTSWKEVAQEGTSEETMTLFIHPPKGIHAVTTRLLRFIETAFFPGPFSSDE